MQEELEEVNGSLAFLSNLRLSAAVLTLFMVLNVASIFLISSGGGDTNTADEATIETFSQEYFSGDDQYNYSNSY